MLVREHEAGDACTNTGGLKKKKKRSIRMREKRRGGDVRQGVICRESRWEEGKRK